MSLRKSPNFEKKKGALCVHAEITTPSIEEEEEENCSAQLLQEKCR